MCRYRYFCGSLQISNPSCLFLEIDSKANRLRSGVRDAALDIHPAEGWVLQRAALSDVTTCIYHLGSGEGYAEDATTRAYACSAFRLLVRGGDLFELWLILFAKLCSASLTRSAD